MKKLPWGKIEEDSRVPAEIGAGLLPVRGQVVVRKLVPVRGQAPTPLSVTSQWPDPIAAASQWPDPIAVASPRPDPGAAEKIRCESPGGLFDQGPPQRILGFRSFIFR
jgi:hypothetical protein